MWKGECWMKILRAVGCRSAVLAGLCYFHPFKLLFCMVHAREGAWSASCEGSRCTVGSHPQCDRDLIRPSTRAVQPAWLTKAPSREAGYNLSNQAFLVAGLPTEDMFSQARSGVTLPACHGPDRGFSPLLSHTQAPALLKPL